VYVLMCGDRNYSNICIALHQLIEDAPETEFRAEELIAAVVETVRQSAIGTASFQAGNIKVWSHLLGVESRESRVTLFANVGCFGCSYYGTIIFLGNATRGVENGV
jgi:hypothetical protein